MIYNSSMDYNTDADPPCLCNNIDGLMLLAVTLYLLSVCPVVTSHTVSVPTQQS